MGIVRGGADGDKRTVEESGNGNRRVAGEVGVFMRAPEGEGSSFASGDGVPGDARYHHNHLPAIVP